MSLAEILPAVRQLPRSEQRQLAQLLVEELLLEELGLKPGESYPVLTPYGCERAAAELFRLLNSGEADA
jgi:hypothetical protein